MLKVILGAVIWSTLSFANVSVPNAGLNLRTFDRELLVTVFNIQKSKNRLWKDEVFKELVEQSDLVLIQESVDQFSNYKFEESRYINYFFKSWGNNSYNTGLSTLTRVPFDAAKRLVSPDREPVAATPKVTSIEMYPVKGLEERLLVANTHAINFSSLQAFRRQIAAVAKELKAHKGPMIWVGDFNTWSKRRKRHLDAVMKKLGLDEIRFEKRSELFFFLDHAYVRGAEVGFAEQLQLGISDHEPLRFSIKIETLDSLQF